ncbi:MAG: DUF7674 family protein [Micromonosporaceae bacterium]
MTPGDFVARLPIEVPEAEYVLAEHRADYGDVLPHLLTSDLLRLAIELFERGHNEPVGRLLGFIDHALREGDEALQNAIAVSFVEDACWDDPASEPFIAIWPQGLQTEVERQRSWRP